jgi:hypothetical protein
MSFNNPIWLWGLTGLLIPVGIHLLSLKEGKIIYIGSVRHLRESNTAQFSSIRLNEIFLLLIRCLLITLLVFLLAGFQLNIGGNAAKKLVIIDKGIEKESIAKSLLDSLEQKGFEARFLSKNFPALKDSSNISTRNNYWSLMDDLNSMGAEEIVVVSYNYSKNFRGQRMPKSEKISWITIEPSEKKFIAKSVTLSQDSIWIREASSSAYLTSLTTKISMVGPDDPEQRKNIKIAVYADDQFSYDAKIVFASLKAIEKNSPNRIVTVNLSASPDWIIWLSNKKVEPNNSQLIMYRRCHGDNTNLIEKAGVASLYCDDVTLNAWIITKRLNEDTALRENFTTNLATILLGEEYQNDNDRRTEPERRLWSPGTHANHTTSSKQRADLSGIISALFVLTLLGERILAIKKNQ